MENKKLGVLLIIFSLIFGIFLYYFSQNLSMKQEQLNCKPSQECLAIDKTISFTHLAFGFFGFMFSLGFYLLFFNKTEKAILMRLEEEKERKIGEEKFDLILKALDPYEKKVMSTVREQNGITQNTLRLKTNMSKAKLSYVLQELERRDLIKRIEKGRTLQIFLKI